MNAKEYAKHRGVSAVQVHKYLKAGKIPSARQVGRTYVIDPVLADQDLAQHLSPDRGGRNGHTPRAAAPAAAPGSTAGPVDPSVAVPNYAISRAIRETYAAKILRLEFEQKSGKLIDKGELRLKLTKLHMAVRDNLRTIPDRVAPVLVGETDQAKIHALLLKEIGQALEGLGNLDWR
jgi:hypothetical protein